VPPRSDLRKAGRSCDADRDAVVVLPIAGLLSNDREPQARKPPSSPSRRDEET